MSSKVRWYLVLGLLSAHVGRVEAATLFSRTFGTMGADALGAIVPDEEGGFFVAGELDASEVSRDILLARLDPAGRAVWQRRWADLGGLGRPAIARAADGSVLLVAPSEGAAWLVRLDESGAVDWQGRFRGRGEAWPHAAVATRDGGFVVVGRTRTDGGPGEGWVLSVDAQGVPIREQVLAGESEAELTAVGHSAERGLMLAGTVDEGAVILELSERGELVRALQLEGPGDVRLVAVGPHAVAGTLTGVTEEAVVLWLDGGQMGLDAAIDAAHVADDGSVLVSGRFGISLLSAERKTAWSRGPDESLGAQALTRAPDGSFAIAGSMAEDGRVLILDAAGLPSRACGGAASTAGPVWHEPAVPLRLAPGAVELVPILGTREPASVPLGMAQLAVSGPCAGIDGGGGCSVPVSGSIDSIQPDTFVCLGTEQTFYGVGDGDGPLTFEWDFGGDGDVDATGETVSYTIDNPGFEDVALVVTDQCDSETAYDYGTVVIMDNPHPVITQGCAGADIVLDAGPSWYQQTWSPGGATSRTINIGQDTTTVYSVTVMDFAGCSGGDTHQAVAGSCADAFEADDTCLGTRESLEAGPVRQHNFFDDASDWSRVHACEGRTLVIETSALGPQADTVLELYDEDCTTLLATDDTRIEFTSPEDRVYALRVRQANGTSGPGRTYALSLVGDTDPCAAFVQTLGSDDDDEELSEVCATTDGGLAFIGTLDSGLSANPRRLWLVRLDADGALLWDKEVPGISGGYDVRGASLVAAPDGGVIALVDYVDGFVAHHNDILLMSIAADGSVLWQKRFDGLDDQRPRRLSRRADGALVVTGTLPGADDYNLFILEMSAAGTFLDEIFPSGPNLDHFGDYLATPDGGGIFGSSTLSYGPCCGWNIWLAKRGPGMQMVWEHAYGGAGDDQLAGVEQTRDGGYLLAAHSTSAGAGGYDVWIVRLDAAGNILWQRTFGTAGDERAAAVRELPDRRIVVAARQSFAGAGGEDLWLLTLGPEGSLLDQHTWGGPGDDVPLSLIVAPDNAIVVSGTTRSFGPGAPAKTNGWVLKLMPDGDFPGGCGLAGSTSVAAGIPALGSQTVNSGAGPYDGLVYTTSLVPIDSGAESAMACFIRLPYEVSGGESLSPLESGSGSLVFLGPTELGWDGSGTGAASFNVYRGDVSGLATGDYGSCFAPDVEGSSAIDSGTPPAGTVWSYLVTGRNARGEGTLGNSAGGAGRPNLDPCP